MTTKRAPLVTAALLAALLFAEYVISVLLNNGIPQLIDPVGNEGAFWSQLVPYGLIPALLREAAFGVGAFVSLRFVAPVTAGDPWARVIRRGVIAALLGSAGVLVLAVIEAVLSVSTPGPYPFGYSFSPTVNLPAMPQALLFFLQPVPALFVARIVPAVLAVVLLRLWLVHQVAKLTSPASPSEKP